MKKQLLLLASALLLASCATPAPTPTSSASTPASSATGGMSSNPAATSYPEVDGVPGVPSGLYIHGSSVYEIDQVAKTIVSYNFNNEYAKLKSKDGVKNFEAPVRFVDYATYGPAIRFEVENATYFLFKDKDKIAEHRYAGEGSWSGSYISPLPNFIEPTYGSYVSGECEQAKVDEKGERIYDSQGASVKEKFYLFLDLTSTSAKVYVGDNDKTHRDEPLHQIENYVAYYNAGGYFIKIPHQGGEFNCGLTIRSATEISFNNAYEKHGDYSAAGTFTLIEK